MRIESFWPSCTSTRVVLARVVLRARREPEPDAERRARRPRTPPVIMRRRREVARHARRPSLADADHRRRRPAFGFAPARRAAGGVAADCELAPSHRVDRRRQIDRAVATRSCRSPARPTSCRPGPRRPRRCRPSRRTAAAARRCASRHRRCTPASSRSPAAGHRPAAGGAPRARRLRRRRARLAAPSARSWLSASTRAASRLTAMPGTTATLMRFGAAATLDASSDASSGEQDSNASVHGHDRYRR